MNNITINDNGSQEENQKTTPVTESPFELNNSSISLPGFVLQIWLGIRDDYRTLIGLNSLGVVERDDEDVENSDV